MNLGTSHGRLREYQQAIDYQRQALPIFRDLGNRDREGYLLAIIGRLYVNYDSPESAIQFLQQSLEVRESIRKQMQQLPQPVQQSYADSVADDYQLLAELLKRQNRNTEAQQVLDLLK
jgi:tetratricopeptide (TPR) repeat protein